MHKICENTGFHWPVFYRIKAESTILLLYERIREVKTRILAYFVQSIAKLSTRNQGHMTNQTLNA